MGSELHARSPDELDYDGATPDTEVSTPVNPYGPGDVLGGTKDKKRLLAREKLVRLSLEEKVSSRLGWEHSLIVTLTDTHLGFSLNGCRLLENKGCAVSVWHLPSGHVEQESFAGVGRHLASEAKARSANILLAPTVCLHRHPLGRRNFESFSEDPVLTGKLAAQYIGELQEKGVAATIIKHFVGNEKETNRLTIDSRISERPLQEIYLRPFEIAVREANPWAIMTSYNLVNETHADMHENVLKDILRGEWGYDGAGCDIGFPFSTKWRFEKLLTALEQGKLSLQDIDRAAENALTLVQRVKGDDMSAEQEEREEDRPETRDLIREAGAQSLTLLKNEGAILPINPQTTKVAVIGPNASRAITGGGGSASLNPYYNTLPLDSIREAAQLEVSYAVGCHINEWLPVASPVCRTRDGEQGVSIDWFAGDKLRGKPVVTQRRTNTNLFLWDSAPLALVGPEWSAIATTFLTPTTSGKHTISFMSVGPGRLHVDGRLALGLWDWTKEGEAMIDGSIDYLVEVGMEAGKAVELRVEMTNELRPAAKQKEFNMTHKYGGCRIGFKEDTVDYLQQAVDAARAADVAVIIVGLDAEWESEGYDRQTMDLPSDGSQDRLIEAVLDANPRTVAWYQGQEAGNALADVLFGRKCPSGELPCPFPRRLQDTPAYHNWPGENLEVVYGEGVYVGHRHYERVRIAPLFPFGHGLSYTSFEYGRPSLSGRALSGPDDVLELVLGVGNVGTLAGAETVQVYVADEWSRLPGPRKELAAFEKVFLEADETKHLRIHIDRFAVGYYDTSVSRWVAEEGRFNVLTGASSADIRHQISFDVTQTFSWVF
ncbi:hypothetical protein RB601_006314 [Gaeumannomyces tritici]